MSNIALKNELTIRIITDKFEILNYLQKGTNIPVLSEHHKFILETFKYMRFSYDVLSRLTLVAGNAIMKKS